MRTLERTLGWLVASLALAALLGAGCASDSGSKEFIPGKGWRSTAVESHLAIEV